MSASIKQIWNNVAGRPIYPNNCGLVFLWKYILVFEKLYFSFDRSNMQIFTLNITRVVWPHVTNLLDLRYFCRHNPLFYHLNLIARHYWSWQRNIFFLVNIFVGLLAFKRQKDGYKVSVKISSCNCVVLSWDELKVRQNLLHSDYEIYMVCLLVATVYWHKSLQFEKKSNMTLLPCLLMILLAVSMISYALPHFSQI